MGLDTVALMRLMTRVTGVLVLGGAAAPYNDKRRRPGTLADSRLNCDFARRSERRTAMCSRRKSSRLSSCRRTLLHMGFSGYGAR